jgi:hypothetical protein
MRPAQLLLAAAVGSLGCSSNGPVATPQPDPTLDVPWYILARVASGKPIDAIDVGPAGYVAITHAASLDPKAMPQKNNLVGVSVDGVSWAETTIDPDGHYNSIAFGAGRYVAAGGMASGGGPGKIIASTDGLHWAQVGAASAVLRKVRFTSVGFIAVGMDGVIVTSPDGTTWTESSDVSRGFLWDAAYGAGRYVAGGFTLQVSSDGRAWSTVTCGPDLPCMNVTDPSGGSHGILQLSQIDFGNGVFVASGVAGLLRSTDGLQWTSVPADRFAYLGFTTGRFLRFAPQLLMAPPQPLAVQFDPGLSYEIQASTDGTTWISHNTATDAATDLTCAKARCFVYPTGLFLVPNSTK